ncbi:MAG: hypothetical protein ACI915_005393 [Gammaproteobacteria bacterium]|jgi:hypothetical protein
MVNLDPLYDRRDWALFRLSQRSTNVGSPAWQRSSVRHRRLTENVKGCWTRAASKVSPFSTGSWGRCLKSLEGGNRGGVLMSYGDSTNELSEVPFSGRPIFIARSTGRCDDWV